MRIKWTNVFFFFRRRGKGKNKIDGTEDERRWVEKDGQMRIRLEGKTALPGFAEAPAADPVRRHPDEASNAHKKVLIFFLPFRGWHRGRLDNSPWTAIAVGGSMDVIVATSSQGVD